MVTYLGVHLSEGSPFTCPRVHCSVVRGFSVHVSEGSPFTCPWFGDSPVRRFTCPGFICTGFTCPYFSSTMTFLAEIEAVLMKRILYRVWGRRSPSGDPWEWRPVGGATPSN